MHLRLSFGSLALTVLLTLGLAQNANTPKPSMQLRYANGSFRIVSNKQTTLVSTQASTSKPVVRPPEKLLFRKDDAYVVWDARGLSIRKGEKVKNTGLEDATLSPKLFTPEQIQENYALFAGGFRHRSFTRLIGAKRVGNSVFFLAEWQDVAGDPWLQAIFEADLAGENPTFALVGPLPGKAINITEDWDRLLLTSRGIVAFVDGADGWGRVALNSKDKQLIFEPLGKGLIDLRKRTDRLAHYSIKTEYGSVVMGQVPLTSGDAVPLIETKGSVRLLDSETPWLFIEADQRGRDLHNSETGAERMIPSDTGIARTKHGILVWSPQKNPNFAELLDTSRLEVIARWSPEIELKLRDQESVKSKPRTPTKRPPTRRKR